MNLTKLIESNREPIIAIWLDQVRRAPPAEGLDDEEIVGWLRDYLEFLCLDSGRPLEPRPRHRESRIVEHHLALRLLQGFNLDAVVHEYTFLGEALSRMWAELPDGEQPSGREIEALFVTLNSAISTAVKRFGRHLAENEQDEKKYLRILDRIASDALHQPKPEFRCPVGEMIAVVHRALGAEACALLFFDPENQRFETAAAIGAERIALVEQALASARFLQNVVNTDEAVDLVDESTEAGARRVFVSLLGHRLCAQAGLIGLLLAATADGRGFRLWQRSRLSAMSRRLSLLVDNSRLFQERQESINELEAERELRDRFVSIVAHDLRGPLTAAMMYTQIVARIAESVSAKGTEISARILRNLDRADQMIRDLLDANRLRAGMRLPLDLESVDLVELARDAVFDLRAIHGDRISLHADPDVRGFWSPSELRRTIWNLVVNAVKYGDPEKPIGIFLARTTLGASVAVHNEGRSISHLERARLFQPFSRLLSKQVGAQRGWGLGLTLVRGTAEAHGGHVVVESEPGIGTTFIVHLPLDSRPFQPSLDAAPSPAN